MSWRDLLKRDERVVLPWLGGRRLRGRDREWRIDELPPERGWWRWSITGNVAKPLERDPIDAIETIEPYALGFLVGNRLAERQLTARVEHIEKLPIVHLLPGHRSLADGQFFEQLDRFDWVSVGRVHEGGPLIFRHTACPEGPIEAVREAFFDRAESIAHVKGVSPALEVAFRLETWQRAETERRQAEIVRLHAEQAAREAKEAQRAQLIKQLGDGASRRALAAVDFEPAARAALTIGGATLLDVRGSLNNRIVRYRVDGARYECVCDERMQVLDAGICLTEHGTGIKGDTWLTLESLPNVIRQAIRENKLVIFRHA